MRYAKMNEAQLAQLQALELELGTPILALEPIQEIASLQPDQIDSLQALEEELEKVLVAVHIHQLA